MSIYMQLINGMQVNQTVTNNFLLSKFHQYWENAFYLFLFEFSVFLNKQNEIYRNKQ